MSPRFRGEGWLLRLSRLAEDPMRLWRRLVTGGVACTTSYSPHNLKMRCAGDADVRDWQQTVGPMTLLPWGRGPAYRSGCFCRMQHTLLGPPADGPSSISLMAVR